MGGGELLQVIETRREGTGISREWLLLSGARQAAWGAVGSERLASLREREVATELAKTPLERLEGGFATVLAFWAKYELKWITEFYKTETKNNTYTQQPVEERPLGTSEVAHENVLCPSPGAFFLFIFFLSFLFFLMTTIQVIIWRNEQHSMKTKR